MTDKRGEIPIIEISDGFKHYGFKNRHCLVLNHLELKAYRDEIYVLLGPGNCGKTTVINILLGLTRLNHGTVTIFGFKPGHPLCAVPGIRVGYAPQTRGLHQNLTIAETLRYYGNLFGLERPYILQRTAFLNELLKLPHDNNNQIQHLPGVLQAQISFAVAILHEPDLLILDEPTAGVDPVIRKSIWSHLKDLVKSQKVTAFVSSKDLVDVPDSQRVGVMKNGYILVEDSPKVILNNYHYHSIQKFYHDAYALNLTTKVTNKTSVPENPNIALERIQSSSSEGFIYVENNELDNPPPPIPDPTKGCCNCIECRLRIRYCMERRPRCERIRVLIVKEVFRCIRNYIWLISFLLLPLFFMLIFGYTIGQVPYHLNLCVVNNDDDCSASSNSPSCIVLRNIDAETIVQTWLTDLNQAVEKVEQLKSIGILEIDKGFGESMKRQLALMRKRTVNLMPTTANLHIYLDRSNRMVADLVEKTVFEAFATYVRDEGSRFEYFPIIVEKPIFANKKTTTGEYLAPALVVVLAFYMSALICGLNIVQDKHDMLYQRDYMAGVKLAEIAVSNLVVYGFLVFVQTALVFIVIVLVLKYPIRGNIAFAIPVILVQIFCGTCLGVLLSRFFRRRIHLTVAVFCVLVMSLLLCGVFWPEEGMPYWMQYIEPCFPTATTVTALRNIMLRGMSLRWFEMVIPLVWAIVFIIIFNIPSPCCL